MEILVDVLVGVILFPFAILIGFVVMSLVNLRSARVARKAGQVYKPLFPFITFLLGVAIITIMDMVVMLLQQWRGQPLLPFGIAISLEKTLPKALGIGIGGALSDWFFRRQASRKIASSQNSKV